LLHQQTKDKLYGNEI